MSAGGTAATPPPVSPARGWRRLLVEPPRPAAVRDRPSAFWLVVATVCIGAFMNQLDASIVTVAFPTLQRQFHVTIGAVTWVGLTYLLTLVGLITAVGRVADMVGRKLLYIYGFLVFIVGSALCGLAPTLGALDVFRVLQGIGAAMIQANSVAIIVLAVPAGKLGRAIGIQGAAQALGLAMGPTLGGLLIALGGWRLIFFVNVPAGLIGTALGWFLIPRSRHLQARVAF
ncbi:MAG: MFS transporter, partial [Acidimicrobiales bacterium]